MFPSLLIIFNLMGKYTDLYQNLNKQQCHVILVLTNIVQYQLIVLANQIQFHFTVQFQFFYSTDK